MIYGLERYDLLWLWRSIIIYNTSILYFAPSVLVLISPFHFSMGAWSVQCDQIWLIFRRRALLCSCDIYMKQFWHTILAAFVKFWSSGATLLVRLFWFWVLVPHSHFWSTVSVYPQYCDLAECLTVHARSVPVQGLPVLCSTWWVGCLLWHRPLTGRRLIHILE